jgi:hypothetical protein
MTLEFILHTSVVTLAVYLILLGLTNHYKARKKEKETSQYMYRQVQIGCLILFLTCIYDINHQDSIGGIYSLCIVASMYFIIGIVLILDSNYDKKLRDFSIELLYAALALLVAAGLKIIA